MQDQEEKEKSSIEAFDEKNAAVITELLTDPNTSEAIRLQIINDLNETAKSETFFETMYNEQISLGACPHCQHKNHWLIPEDDLAQMGWVSSKKDFRVKRNTTAKDCPEYAEACAKKKTSV